jgi:hypothetical protein
MSNAYKSIEKLKIRLKLAKYDLDIPCQLLKMNSKKARMTVSIEPELHDVLVDRAKKQGRTPGNLASWLLSRAIQELSTRDEDVK